MPPPVSHPQVRQLQKKRERYPYIVQLPNDGKLRAERFAAEYPLADFARHVVGDNVVWMFRTQIDKKEFEQWASSQ